jgi:CHAT domain-containing protein
VAADNFYTLLLTPSGTTAFSHPTRAVDANKMVDEFLNVLRSPASPDEVVQKHGSRLYNVIFKSTSIEDVQQSLQAMLEKYEPDVLLWSLDGKLRYIPVAALYEAERQQYLVEKYQSAVFTRAKTERLLREPTPWTEGLGFGASKAPKITCGSKRLSELLSVTGELLNMFSDEAKEKGISFKGHFFLNGDFTRTSMVNNLKARKPPLVHISSHFCFQPGDARSSFLLLGDGKPFSLYEMQAVPNLFDGVETLTLSACETAALQPNATGKEIDSFAELAQRLRANSVIATLWSVDDAGSSELMTNFYRLYKEHQDWPKAELLRQAQLRLLKTGPNLRRAHPYYWAPFVLYGGFR